MDPHQAKRVALLSIKPEYAHAIFDGYKQVEFRRSRLAPDIELVIVYATQPLGHVLGFFRVAGICESTPDGIWRRFNRVGGIRRRDYFDYFAGASRAYAIEIREPTAIEAPISLHELIPGLRPPQSFQYLPAAAAAPAVDKGKTPSRRHPLRPVFA